MNPLHAATAGAMLAATGVVLLARAIRPAPPRLDVVIGQRASPAPAAAPVDDLGAPRVWRWLPQPALAAARRHLSVADADLAILGTDRTTLLAVTLSWTIAGLLAPALLAAAAALAGIPWPWPVTGLTCLLSAAAGWLLPPRLLAERATAARAEFAGALTAFLNLVGLERAARGSPTEALEEASAVSGTWPFTLIHDEVRRAELAGRQPWDALRELGTRIGVEELRNLADILASAADGAAVFDTLLAAARSLRNADLTRQHTDAALAAERMTYPLTILAIGFIATLIYPAFTRLL